MLGPDDTECGYRMERCGSSVSLVQKMNYEEEEMHVGEPFHTHDDKVPIYEPEMQIPKDGWPIRSANTAR